MNSQCMWAIFINIFFINVGYTTLCLFEFCLPKLRKWYLNINKINIWKALDYSFSSVTSVTKSCLTLCSPHGLQPTRFPCPSPSPGICSNSCSLSWWCHPTISSSCHPLLLLLPIFPILLKYFKFLRLDYFLLCILVTCQVVFCGQDSLVDKSEAQDSERFGLGYLEFLPFISCVAHKLCVMCF